MFHPLLSVVIVAIFYTIEVCSMQPPYVFANIATLQQQQQQQQQQAAAGLGVTPVTPLVGEIALMYGYPRACRTRTGTLAESSAQMRVL